MKVKSGAMGLFKFSLVMIVLSFSVTVTIGQEDKLELKLLNVVFRHGDRAPDPTEVYPNDPYRNNSFYPMTRGGLTNGGKRRVYEFGKLLRARYDEFLGPIYEPWTLAARSSDYDRTKMSLQLVLSGLFPPAPLQRWNEELAWQPIPAEYKPLSQDILFEPELCPKYLAELDRVRESPEVMERQAELSTAMAFLETKTGKSIKTSQDFYHLFHVFTAQSAVGLPLPSWAEEVYPDGKLFDGTVLEYEVVSFNAKMKKLNGGMFVRKISEDLAGFRSGTLPAGRKLYLYSGHETNMASLQLALGVYEPHIPQYSSGIIFELWQRRDQFFVKIVHHLGIPATTKTLKMPGCEELCPLDSFLELIQDVLPSDSDLICVKKPSQVTAAGFIVDPTRNKI